MAPQASLYLTPTLRSFLETLKTNTASDAAQELALLLKRRQITQPHSCAIATSYLMLRTVTTCKTNEPHKLIDAVREVAMPLIQAQPREMVIGNIVRRVLGLIRDEIDSSEQNAETETETETETDAAKNNSLRMEVIDGVNEIIDELVQVYEQIAYYAPEHIHSNEVIMTYGASLTVQKFLLKAAAKRRFTVMHVESYPNNHMASQSLMAGVAPADPDNLTPLVFQKSLADHGITVVLVPDAAVFAMMSRVNKVILGTHVVLSNGGLLASAGTRVIATAAQKHDIPVVVLSGVYKLSPVYPFNPDSLIEFGNPAGAIKWDDKLAAGLEARNPLFDFVPPDLVNLYITNLGGHAPSYLSRIVSDHYRKEDIDLFDPRRKSSENENLSTFFDFLLSPIAESTRK